MRVLIIIMLTCLVLSCNNSKNEDVSSEILVKIGSENITRDDLAKELDKLSYKQKTIYTSSPKKLNEFLQTHINEKVLYKEAYKRGIQDREDIQEQIDSYQKKLIAKTFGKEILEELELSSDEVKDYYEQNKKNYERIDISKIVIKFNTSEDNSKASALSKAEEISDRAKSGENFEELAIEFSDDPISKKRGGKVGYVNKGRFPESIDEAIFVLNKGDITKPFEVDGGYLIIKANKEPDFPPFGQVERTIRSELINEGLFNYINDLKEDWEVQVYEDRLEEMYKSESNEK